MAKDTVRAEEWRWVVGLEGAYQVSSFGRVRSVDRIVKYLNQGKYPASRVHKGVILKPFIREGYFSVNIETPKYNKCTTRSVHALVAESFLDEKPTPEHEVRHLDGNRLNPSFENLRWGTHKENAQDMIAHGRTGLTKGEAFAHAVLTEEKVRFIRASYPKITPTELSNIFNCHLQTIWHVIYNRTWRHV